MDEMRYGENPHQAAAFYRDAGPTPAGTIANYQQLQGKALSYNNIADTDAALECVKVFDEPACVIVKHANPCGVGIGADLAQAIQRRLLPTPHQHLAALLRSTVLWVVRCWMKFWRSSLLRW